MPSSAVVAWKAELNGNPAPQPARAARLHLSLGEWEIAYHEQPKIALWHFAMVRLLTSTRDPLYGLASYDTAVTHFREGAYRTAVDEFNALVKAPITRGLRGYDRANCALFARHAMVCAGYHEERSKMGIPEPPQLDPNCGAAGLAVCLQHLGLPYDEKTVLTSCRVTGLGSNAQDLLNACNRFGSGSWVTGRWVGASDAGLKALPLPAVAYCEHDHFIAVTKADRKGVTYVCSDCGCWPGGEVRLSWKQWHKLEPSLYLTVVKKGGAEDKTLTKALDPAFRSAVKTALLRAKMRGVQVASAGPSSGLSTLPLLSSQAAKIAELVVMGNGGFDFGSIGCGSSVYSLHCPECLICCLFDLNCEIGGGQGGVGLFGAAAYDPVNLATLEEEYTPSSDLVVYNPSGPSVSWHRIYNSLRPSMERANPNDPSNTASVAVDNREFGRGWSWSYNVSISKGTTSAGATNWSLVLENGGRIFFTSSATPTSASPIVHCTVQAGAPCQIDYIYTSAPGTQVYGNLLFQVTWSNGTKWNFQGNQNLQSASGYPTRNLYFAQADHKDAWRPGKVEIGYASYSQLEGGVTAARRSVNHTESYASIPQKAPAVVRPFSFRTADYFVLSRIENRTGQGINFQYASSASSVLDSINDDSGSALLTISHTNGGGILSNAVISSVADRYGRSVYYAEGMDDSSPDYGMLTHVSQIVATGTTSPPDRYVYSYQTLVANGELESFPFLHTITVPSPTGTGTSTATINYDPTTLYVSSLVDGNGNTRSYTVVDGTHTKVTVTNPSAHVDYSYTGNFDSNMSEVSKTNGSGTTLYTKTFSDPNDPYRPSQLVDNQGHQSQYTWDQYGNGLTETSPRGTVKTYTWDYTHFSLGRMTQVQEGMKASTQYTYYEPSGLLQSVTAPVPGTSGSSSTVTYSFTYDGMGNPLTITTPGNNATSLITRTLNYTVDGTYTQSAAIGKPLTITVDAGTPAAPHLLTTHFRYNPRGTVQSITDPLGNETDFTYNLADQMLAKIFPGTGQTGMGRGSYNNTYLYAGGPRITASIYDESGSVSPVRQTNYAYGQEGEALSVTGSVENTGYTYDALYRRVSVSDGNGHATTTSYNTAGYIASVTLPGTETVQFPNYDSLGRPTKRIDGNGDERDYTYSDVAGGLSDIQYPATPALNAHYVYDAYGRRSSQTDATGSKSYAYDDRDDLTSATTTYTGLAAKTIAYSYYADGNRSSLSTPAGTFNYAYDPAERETSLTNPFSETTAWTYLDNGWLQFQTLGNGDVVSYTYNALGQITDLLNAAGIAGTTLSEFAAITHDGSGNEIGTIASVPSTPTFSGTTSYQYDTKDEVLQEASTRSGGFTSAFGYDAAENPTTVRGNTHGYNSDNQLTGGTGLATYSYDGNGTPTTYDSTAFTFDENEKLTSVGSAFTAGYTIDGLRAWKQNSVGTRTYFLYDGDTPVVELDASGSVTATNTFGVDGLVSRNTTGTSSGSVYYTFDERGNTSQRLDNTGTIISSHVADAFGLMTSTVTGTSTDPFDGFGAKYGYYTDHETGLVLAAHRYYDAGTGKWLTRDPAGFAGGTNIYAYCNNNPVRWQDPTGLWPDGINDGNFQPLRDFPNPFAPGCGPGDTDRNGGSTENPPAKPEPEPEPEPEPVPNTPNPNPSDPLPYKPFQPNPDTRPTVPRMNPGCLGWLINMFDGSTLVEFPVIVIMPVDPKTGKPVIGNGPSAPPQA